MGNKLYDKDYKVLLPINFKKKDLTYIAKSGKVYKCTCKKMLECFQPYYGWNWYHGDDDCVFNKKYYLDNLIAIAG